MPSRPPASSFLRTLAGISGIILPALIFYRILLRRIVDLPNGDDYDILVFLNYLRTLHGFGARLIYVLTAQHNEYKLIFGHSIFALQYLLLGHVSFAGLCVIGDIAILLLAVVLWKMFLPSQTNLSLRLALFIPASWLLFQLSYGEALNQAEPALQNLYIFLFSFAAFALLAAGRPSRFAGALICIILAIAASGNGFLAAFVGAIVLVRQRRFLRLLTWISVSLGMIFLYRYRYIPLASEGHSRFITISGHKIIYIVSFLGSVGEILRYLGHHFSAGRSSFALGVVLCLVFSYCGLRGKLSTHQAVNAAILFIFLTAIGVSAIRSEYGPLQSQTSRYRIYSSMLLVFVWYLVCEHGLQLSSKPLRRSWLYLTGCACAILFLIAADHEGAYYMDMRNAETVRWIKAYEQLSPSELQAGPRIVFTGPTFPAEPDFTTGARQLLQASEANGIYHAPRY